MGGISWGVFGSEIHWFFRTLAFASIWAIAYGIIAAVKWLVKNWVLITIILVGFGVILFAFVLVLRKRQQPGVKVQEVEKESGEK